MITPGASTSSGSAPVAMRAGTQTFVPPHKAASSQPGDRGHCYLSDGSRHHGFAFRHAVHRCGRTANAVHRPGKDNPDRPSELQSP